MSGKESLKDVVQWQSKTIRNMAEFINGLDIDEEICKHKQFDDDCGTAGRSCIECIIKHFENTDKSKSQNRT